MWDTHDQNKYIFVDNKDNLVNKKKKWSGTSTTENNIYVNQQYRCQVTAGFTLLHIQTK